MKKLYLAVLALTLCIFASLFSGCAPKQQAPQQNQPPQTTPPETTPDVQTTASIVNTADGFKKAISSSGTWIICLTQDISANENLVLEGEFKNGKKDTAGKDIIQRKIALYAQDENRNVTARYTLTAPQIAILSPEARIQSGTFKGDVYVTARNFQLVDTKIDGNLYFTTQEAKDTFKMDEKSSVTGKTEMRTS